MCKVNRSELGAQHKVCTSNLFMVTAQCSKLKATVIALHTQCAIEETIVPLN